MTANYEGLTRVTGLPILGLKTCWAADLDAVAVFVIGPTLQRGNTDTDAPASISEGTPQSGKTTFPRTERGNDKK